jgi:squalene-associated FAD-dependent desaturase
LQEKKIAIIGAGVSGLAAAIRLIEVGCPNITLFEARKEAGGRTRSYIDLHTGDKLDNGQHLLMGCYSATLRYLHAIGSDGLLQRAPLSIRFHEAGREHPAILQIPPDSAPPVNLLAGLWSSHLLTSREKFSATRLGLAIDIGSNTNKYNDMTCQRLFAALHQPAGLITKLWAPIVLATINAPIEKASAMLFINVFREAFLSGREGSDLLLPTAGLSDLLIDPAMQMIEKNGATVNLSTPVRAIEEQNGNLEIVTDGDRENFDAVIYCGQSTAPLPSIIRSTIPEFEFSPIVNAYFWLDRELFSTPLHSFLGTTLQWAFPRHSDCSPQRLASTVSAADALQEHTNEEIRHILWTDICNTIPAARAARLTHYQIIREKRATPFITPSVQNARPGNTTNIPGIFIAGDIVQNGLPATIEGAVRNGFSAADALAAKVTGW